MSAIAAATIGSSIIGGISSSNAAKKAANAQVQAAQLTVDEQRAAREELRTLLAPYSSAGIPALQAQMNLLGIAPQQTNWTAFAQSNPELMAAYNQQGGGQMVNIMGRNVMIPGGQRMPLEQFAQQWQQTRGGDLSAFQTGGAQGQQQAINQFEQSPMFQALARQGEDALLQNAAATGGLRGGNLQGALGQFRPALLNQQIQQQFQNLGGLTALGQSSAAGIGVGGQNAANQIGNALTQAGQAQAGGALGQGAAFNNALGQISGFAASGGFGRGGGGSLTSALNTGSGFFPGRVQAPTIGNIPLGTLPGF
jgi:hypothetical protein